jgi:hypothetical protein
MKKTTVQRACTAIRLGCFGNFRFEDPICRRHCAIRIRCAIERDQEISLEVFEEMDAGDDMLFTFR